MFKSQVSFSTVLLLFTSSASLFLGFSIYIFLRVTPTWFEILLFNMTGVDTQQLVLSYNLSNNFVELLNNHGADFFWMMSLSLGFLYFFSNTNSAGIRKYLAFFYLSILGIFLELGQQFAFLPGTFDIYDIATFNIAIGLSYCCFSIIKKVDS